MPLLSLTAPQLPGEFWERDFVFMAKKCSKCQEFKPATPEYFHRDGGRKDGLSPRCKVCVNKYYQANKEIINERAQQWQKANPEKANEITRRYYRRNKEEVLNLQSLRRQQNPEADRARTRKYRAAHPERSRESARRWYRANPEKSHEKRNLYRARKLNSEGNYTYDEWQALCDFYGNVCLDCGEQKPLTADHVIPITKGGSNYIGNIQPLCKPCNSRKGNKTIDYRTKPFEPKYKQLTLF